MKKMVAASRPALSNEVVEQWLEGHLSPMSGFVQNDAIWQRPGQWASPVLHIPDRDSDVDTD
jgi:hypothetical protein